MQIRIYTAGKRTCKYFRKGSGSRAIAAFFLFFALAGTSARAMDMPWSVSAGSPAFSRLPSFPGTTVDPGDSFSNPFIFLVKGFQKTISPIDGERCRMYPTCSAYSLDAFRRHGTIKGLILTADRLLHEANEHNFAPVIIKHGVYRYYDPVENNDFWW